MRSITTTQEEIILALMQQAAREAGIYIKEQFFIQDAEVCLKSSQDTYDDFVTHVDHHAETIIRDILSSTKIPVVGEENGGKKSSQYFLVDPLDGTTNFVSDVPYFAVCIALIENEKPVLAVIGNPVSGDIYSAIKGKGSFCNDIPIKVCQKPAERLLVIAETTPDRMKEVWDNVCAVTGRSRFAGFRKFGSTALDLAELASGKPIIVLAENLRPWDFAAGWLITEETGGCIKQSDNTPMNINSSTLIAYPKQS